MSAAGARCRLFEPAVAAALAASAHQARGAALRGGADSAAVDALERRARERGAAVACTNPDLATAATRVKNAFAGYARLNVMSFPGDAATWRADRGTGINASVWRLAQASRTAQGPAQLGMAENGLAGEQLTAVAGWPRALAAVGARLVMRDPAKAPAPYIDPRNKSLIAQVAPRPVTRAFLAAAREPAPPTLLPAGAAGGVAFRFPFEAIRAMEKMDPREAVILELVYSTRTGERVEQVAFEVGDFAAGRAFLSARR